MIPIARVVAVAGALAMGMAVTSLPSLAAGEAPSAATEAGSELPDPVRRAVAASDYDRPLSTCFRPSRNPSS